jgi:hypothetical protein
MKSLVAAGICSCFLLLLGIAGWLNYTGFHANPAWFQKAIPNVHEASLRVGVMSPDDRHAYEMGVQTLTAQHRLVANYTIYQLMMLGKDVLRQRHTGISDVLLNEKSDVESVIQIVNAKRRIVEGYTINANRLHVTMNVDGLNDRERRLATDEVRRVWAISYGQRHHWHGAPATVTFNATK